MMPLLFADRGKKYEIKKIAGNQDVKKHLEDLGFTTGSMISVISDVSGNLIVNVKDSRIALNRELANKIYI